MISIPGRIPIIIHPFFWVLIFLLGWLNSSSFLGTGVWAVVIFFSVLIHEYGHALTALFFGQEAEINLVGLGGITQRKGAELNKWKEFIIVLNGPLAGISLAIFSYYALSIIPQGHPIFSYALQVALAVNLFWSVLNLLPILPLDGGQLARILLEGMFGFRGLACAVFLSIILGGLVGAYFFFLQQILLGALFFMLAFEGYRAWSQLKDKTPEDSNPHLQEILQKGVVELKQGSTQEAFEKFQRIRQKAPKGILYVSATQYGARILAEEGNHKKAFDWLFPIKHQLSEEYLRLLQQLAYRLQFWEEAANVGLQAYQQEPSAEIAVINALCYAIMGKEEPAVGWLHNAVQQGASNMREIVKKREFDAIRDAKSFRQFTKNIDS